MKNKALSVFTLVFLTFLFTAYSAQGVDAPLSPESDIAISNVVFISEEGKTLQTVKAGDSFTILVFVERIDEETTWRPFWLKVWVDDRSFADWETGIYQDFVVYSAPHQSLLYESRSEHIIKIQILERLETEPGDLIEEQTISFNVRGKP